MRSTKIVGLLTLLGALIVISAQGDVVVLKNGDRKVGLVKEIRGDQSNIEFTDATGTVKIPRARISEIKDEPEHATYLHIGDQYLEQNNLLEARRYFNLARNEAPDEPEVKAALDKVELAIQSKQTDEDKRKEELMEIELKNIRQLVADKQFEKAAEKARFLIGVAPTEDQKALLTKQLADVYYKWGVDRQDKLDRINAAIYLSKSYELDSSNQDAFDRLLALWERDPAKTEDVMKIYRDRISKNPEDLVTMNKLVLLLVAQSKFNEALPMLVQLYQSDGYRTDETARMLVRAYEAETKALADKQEFLKAASLYEQYVESFPSTDPAPIYMYEYADKFSKADKNKVEDRLALGDYAKSKGLSDIAYGEYKAAYDLKPENEKALRELTIFAQRDFNDAQRAAQVANYQVAMNMAQTIKEQYSYLPDVVTAANDLYMKAEIEYKKDLREKGEQAQELIRKGDEYFQTGVYHMNMMKESDRSDSRRPVSDKLEAISNFEFSLRCYQSALKLDSRTASVENGDVRNKITRTQSHLRSLKNPVPLPMPSGSSPSGSRRYN